MQKIAVIIFLVVLAKLSFAQAIKDTIRVGPLVLKVGKDSVVYNFLPGKLTIYCKGGSDGCVYPLANVRPKDYNSPRNYYSLNPMKYFFSDTLHFFTDSVFVDYAP